MFELDDLIAAVASPPGAAPRGILRVSGTGLLALVEREFSLRGAGARFDHRRARRYVVELRLEGALAPLRVDLHLWPDRRSYTGQPMAEIHLPGSAPLIEAVLEHLLGRGCRLARPGEFTLRSFLAGRIDLPQAEAVLGVIDAADRSQLDLALEQLAGGMSRSLGALREQLLCDLADLEAGLDFVDEDIEFITRDALEQRLTAARRAVETLLRQSEERHRERSRPQVVLAGLPNAGKSSLFNTLAGRPEAIVSDIAGTTRDVLQATVMIDGTGIDLLDTAGWEEPGPGPGSGIDSQAMQQRQDRLQGADLVLWCTAPGLSAAEQAADVALRAELGTAPSLEVRTKCDVPGEPADTSPGSTDAMFCSARTGSGVGNLRRAILVAVRRSHGRREGLLPSTAVRCREDLRLAATALERSYDALTSNGGDEIVAMELRSALEHIGEVTGSVSNEDVLDRLFSRFCIGK